MSGAHIGGLRADVNDPLDVTRLMDAKHEKIRSYHHGDLRRVLIEAAMTLVTETQDWDFSLREVARRAGVASSAPYNHFQSKRDLLGAVAAVGFFQLRDRMLAASDATDKVDVALGALAQAYVGFAVENPARYRLMFGPALVEEHPVRPAAALAAGAEAKAVMLDVIRRGANLVVLAVDPDDLTRQELMTLAYWSSLHGIAMLVIDEKVESPLPPSVLVENLMQHLLNGLRRR